MSSSVCGLPPAYRSPPVADSRSDADGGGRRARTETIGAVATSRRPSSRLARCLSISTSVARPAATSPARVCSTVATLEAGARRGRHREVGGRPRRRPGRGSAAVGAPFARRRGRRPGRPAGNGIRPGPGWPGPGRARVRRYRPGAAAPGRHPRRPATLRGAARRPGRRPPRPAAAGGRGRGARGSGRRDPPEAGRWSRRDAAPRPRRRPLPGPRGVPEPGDVDVGGHHRARRAHPGGQPGGHPRTAGPDLPAAPARADTRLLEDPEGRRVEELGDGGQPDAGLGLPVVQQVPACPVGRFTRPVAGRTAQESTRRRKLRSPSPRNSARKPASTGKMTYRGMWGASVKAARMPSLM